MGDGNTTRKYGGDCTLSVADAVREAMASTITTPSDLPAPTPHLPLRKASPERLQAKRATPKPLWTPVEHQVRGFNPAPARAVPLINTVTASSEHAFAAKEEGRKQAFKPPLLGPRVLQQVQEARGETIETPHSSPTGRERPPSSPLFATPPPSPLRAKAKSLRSSKPATGAFKGLTNRLSGPARAKGPPPIPGEVRSSVPVVPTMAFEHGRESFPSAVDSGSRSAVTSNSSFRHTGSIHTEHSSLTAPSSHAEDFVQVYPDWPQTTPDEETDDEIIDMYVHGFEGSTRPSLDTEPRAVEVGKSEKRPSSQRSHLEKDKNASLRSHRRSQSASLLERGLTSDDGFLVVHPPNRSHTFSRILSSPVTASGVNRPSTDSSRVQRDRYGFKKASLYITAEQYDAWNVNYSTHLERRQKKWHALMKSYGLNTEQPFRFPPKSDKIKRYVRKGIPSELRGAAWFWYAGGPGKLAKDPDVYQRALEKVEKGELSDNDREHIERDLNRTFPDNIRFKPDPVPTEEAKASTGGGGSEEAPKRKRMRHSVEPETPMVQSLRRVLQAFAAHNPHIGYCQSLNFIAGLLLLFLDQDEEKAFVLMDIVTTTHLPGTHGIALEGANIDIAVLMNCVKDSLPAIWAKLDDNGGSHLAQNIFPGAEALRLPTISLATTAWFMSLFVGTLPIESVLRIWDCLFFEGSKTLFRIALAIFKFGEKAILAVHDPMEIFQVVQTIPRSMLDINALMEVCFRRRGGFGHVSQGLIEGRREERRAAVRAGMEAGLKEGGGGRVSMWRGRLKSITPKI